MDRPARRVDRDREIPQLQRGPAVGDQAGQQRGQADGAAAARGHAVRVDRVAQRVAQGVHGEDGQGQRGAGPQQQQRRLGHGGARGPDHQPPGRRGRHDSQAQEGQAGFQHHGGRGGEAELHQHGAGDVGQDGATHDPHRPGAEGAHRLHIVLRADGEHACVHDAHEARQIEHGEHRDQRARAGPQQRDDQQGEQQRRKAQHHVHAADGQHLHDPAQEPAHQAEQDAQEAGDSGGGRGDGEGDARAPEQPGQHVAPVFVLAQPVRGGGAGEPVGDVHPRRVVERQERHREREQRDPGDGNDGRGTQPHPGALNDGRACRSPRRAV